MAVVGRAWSVAKGYLPKMKAPVLLVMAAALALACALTPLPRDYWAWLVTVLLLVSLLLTKPENEKLTGPDQLLELGTRGSLATAALRFIVVLAVGSLVWGRFAEAIVGTSALVIVLLMLPARILTVRLKEQLTASVFTRGFGDSDLGETTGNSTLRFLASGWPLVLPSALLILTLLVPSDSVLVALVALISMTLAVFITGYIWWASKTKGVAIRRKRIEQLEQTLADYAPTVALYSCGGQVLNLFWVTMWLPVVEQLQEKSVLIVRSEAQFDAMPETSLPVISVGRTSDLLDLDLSPLRAGLYVSNTATTIHLLKHRNIMSAFIGHGDSDKQSSTNPFAKVYDELWVAGEAGADRFRRAEVGVHEDQFVHVGRPTLDAIEVTKVRSQVGADGEANGGSGLKMVLYAPTWEGWDVGQEYTSVHQGGVKMIKRLLESNPAVRIVYKGHPYAGQRLRSVTAANNQIKELLRQANARISDPKRKHIIARHGDKHLYDWFNEADFLVTDITGVLSDYVASEKPYAVFNFTDENAQDFAREYPSASAGLTYNSSAESLDALAEYIADPATYREGEKRRELRTYLLGDPAIPAMQKFQTAVTELVAKSEARIQARVSR